jgi:5-methylcytosine-specific restriction endonuclease McrA
MIAIHHNPLSRLSDSQLIQRLDALVQKERETTLEVIRHIIEFDRRKLYLGIGYNSLHKYCILHLGFSEPAAMRRIQAARCIRDFPEIDPLLAKNELNLTGICKLAGILNERNKKDVMQEARCKSSRQIDEIVARYIPAKDVRDRVCPIFVSAGADGVANENHSEQTGSCNTSMPGLPSTPDDSKQANSNKTTFGADGKKLTTFSDSSKKSMILKKKYKIEFSVEPECMQMLEETKAILSKKYPKGVPLGKLLEEALNAYLDKHSPERKKKRRETRETKKQERNNTEQNKNSQENKIEKAGKKNSRMHKTEVQRSRSRGPTHSEGQEYNRHIPQSIRDEVFARDKGRCTFIGPDGKRCNSTWNLHIDHIKPFAKGGGHNIQNLRLLCANHNHLEAERVYGKHFIKRRRYESKAIIE